MQMGLGSYNVIAYDLREFHDFDLRSFGQVLGHWKKVQDLCLVSIMHMTS